MMVRERLRQVLEIRRTVLISADRPVTVLVRDLDHLGVRWASAMVRGEWALRRAAEWEARALFFLPELAFGAQKVLTDLLARLHKGVVRHVQRRTPGAFRPSLGIFSLSLRLLQFGLAMHEARMSAIDCQRANMRARFALRPLQHKLRCRHQVLQCFDEHDLVEARPRRSSEWACLHPSPVTHQAVMPDSRHVGGGGRP